MKRILQLVTTAAHAIRAKFQLNNSIQQVQSDLIDRFERGEQLSLQNWRTLVFFAEQGATASHFDQTYLLRAFVALFEFRATPESNANCRYYISNLPHQIRGRLKSSYTPSEVRHFTEMTLEVIRGGNVDGLWPLLPGRSLSALLEFDRLTDIRSVNAALMPYWPELTAAACLAFRDEAPTEAEPTR
ncbi:MAG TPA: hypothetical protein VF283_16765 [Bryobacteraceae bacterium]